MRVLVTGAGGFVGRHAVSELLRAGHSVAATSGPGHDLIIPGVEVAPPIDLRDAGLIDTCMAKIKPDACLHLAGMAFVPEAWKNPQDAFAINTIGTINLLEAMRKHASNGRILVVTSAQIYGHKPRATEISEEDPPAADSIYATSKWAADMATLLYAQRYKMHTMTARPCNHIGPGQSESFAISSFARQMIEISLGRREPVMKVGNLASEREFTDVRDVVRAYRLLLERGQAGLAYNITSGKFLRIQQVFEQLCAITGVKPSLEIDPALFRPTDSQPKLNTSRLVRDTDWKPEVPMETTLRDVVEDFRRRIAST